MSLILTRREGESIKIGENVWITVSAVDGNRAKLSIDAPREVVVLRGELCKSLSTKTESSDISLTKEVSNS